MERKYSGADLPKNSNSWNDAAQQSGIVSIHELETAYPASQITMAQFLSLKTLWPALRAPTELYNNKWAMLFGSTEADIKTTRHKMKEHDSEWNAYLTALEDIKFERVPLRQSSKFPRKLGAFSLVLQNQLEVLQINGPLDDSNKLRLISLDGRYNMRKRAGEPKPDNKGKEKESSPHSQESQQSSQASKVSSDPSNVSPTRREAEPDLQIGDEQIVNTAAINFLNALFIYHERSANWTLQRKQFKFHSRSVSFEARTDGHLHVRDTERSAAILEVKPRPRVYESGFRIEMQESAQMALWIFQEPNSHWSAPSGNAPSGIAPSGNDKFYRVLLSQDRQEIYVTIAEYTMDYVLYLRDEKSIEQAGFLRMNMFGPFVTRESAAMSSLGAILRIMLPYAADYRPRLQLSPSKLRTPSPRPAPPSDERGRAPEHRPHVGQQRRGEKSPTQRGETKSLSSTSSESELEARVSKLNLGDKNPRSAQSQLPPREVRSDSSGAAVHRSESPFRSIQPREGRPPGTLVSGEQSTKQSSQPTGQPNQKRGDKKEKGQQR